MDGEAKDDVYSGTV